MSTARNKARFSSTYISSCVGLCAASCGRHTAPRPHSTRRRPLAIRALVADEPDGDRRRAPRAALVPRGPAPHDGVRRERAPQADARGQGRRAGARPRANLRALDAAGRAGGDGRRPRPAAPAPRPPAPAAPAMEQPPADEPLGAAAAAPPLAAAANATEVASLLAAAGAITRPACRAAWLREQADEAAHGRHRGGAAPQPYGGGDLEAPGVLDAALRARAPAGELIFLSVGDTRDHRREIKDPALKTISVDFLLNLLANLKQLRIDHYVILTTRSLCRKLQADHCEYSCVWTELWNDHPSLAAWGLKPGDMFLMWAQQWRYISAAMARGYRVMRLDTDVYFAEDPYPILKGPLFGRYEMVVQHDVEGARGRRASGRTVLPLLGSSLAAHVTAAWRCSTSGSCTSSRSRAAASSRSSMRRGGASSRGSARRRRSRRTSTAASTRNSSSTSRSCGTSSTRSPSPTAPPSRRSRRATGRSSPSGAPPSIPRGRRARSATPPRAKRSPRRARAPPSSCSPSARRGARRRRAAGRSSASRWRRTGSWARLPHARAGAGEPPRRRGRRRRRRVVPSARDARARDARARAVGRDARRDALCVLDGAEAEARVPRIRLGLWRRAQPLDDGGVQRRGGLVLETERPRDPVGAHLLHADRGHQGGATAARFLRRDSARRGATRREASDRAPPLPSHQVMCALPKGGDTAAPECSCCAGLPSLSKLRPRAAGFSLESTGGGRIGDAPLRALDGCNDYQLFWD